MDMKKFILLTVLLTLLASCGSKDRGELVGVKGKKWHPEKPYGMELVPGGAYIMGKADDDLAGVHDAPAKTVTVRSFYMDETEIQIATIVNLLIGLEIQFLELNWQF